VLRREVEETDRLRSGFRECGVRASGRGEFDVRRSGKTVLLTHKGQVNKFGFSFLIKGPFLDCWEEEI
jgi:hypothetical protein